MGIHSLQYKYAKGRFTLPLVYFIFSFVWVATTILAPEHPTILSDHSPLWNKVLLGNIPWWLNQAIAYTLYALVSYSLVQLNNQYTIVTQRATIQSSLFLLSIAVIPALQVLSPGLMVALLTIIQTFLLFESYQDSDSMLLQFYTGAISAVLFLLIPKILFLLPLLYLTKIAFNNLNIHTFLASLLGFSLPLWFLFGHAVWHDQLSLFYEPFMNLSNWHFIWSDLMSLDVSILASYMFLSLCTLLSSLYLLFASVKLRVRTRQILNHFLRISLGITLLIALDPSLFLGLSPLWIICISFTYGHALISVQTKLTNYIFILVLVSLIALFSLNLWML